MMIRWQVLAFKDLSTRQLYDFLQLRERVFTIAQKCNEADIDGQDVQALHVMGYHGERLAAYSRLYYKGDVMYIGRVVVNPQDQGKGFGREMMQYTMHYLTNELSQSTVELSAQSHLEKFYQSFGFRAEGEVYEEGGIPHIHMSLVSVTC